MNAFTVQIPVRFGDCDAAGIVFYPRYFEMLNRVVEDWFAGPLGRSFRVLHLEQNFSVPTVRFEVDFRKASRMEDVLDFALEVEKLGRTSCKLRVQVRCGDELRLEVRQSIVFVDQSTMKPTPWPADLRAAMTPFLALETA